MINSSSSGNLVTGFFVFLVASVVVALLVGFVSPSISAVVVSIRVVNSVVVVGSGVVVVYSDEQVSL